MNAFMVLWSLAAILSAGAILLSLVGLARSYRSEERDLITSILVLLSSFVLLAILLAGAVRSGVVTMVPNPLLFIASIVIAAAAGVLAMLFLMNWRVIRENKEWFGMLAKAVWFSTGAITTAFILERLVGDPWAAGLRYLCN